MAFTSGSPRNAPFRPRRKSGSNYGNNNAFDGKGQGQEFNSRNSRNEKKSWGSQEKRNNNFARGNNGRRIMTKTDDTSPKGGLTMENVKILKRGEKIEDVIAPKSESPKNETPFGFSDFPQPDFGVVKKSEYGAIKKSEFGFTKVEPEVPKVVEPESPKESFYDMMIKTTEKLGPQLRFPDDVYSSDESKYYYSSSDDLLKNCYEKSGSETSLFDKFSDKELEDYSYGGVLSDTDNKDIWAGPIYATSPSPKALPMPKFSAMLNKDKEEDFSAFHGGYDYLVQNNNQEQQICNPRFITDPFEFDVFASLDLRKVLNIK